MTAEEISNGVEQILRNLFPKAKFKMSGDLTAKDILGWDSLTHAKFIMAVEEEFQVRVPLKEIMGFENLSDLIHFIKSRVRT